MRYLDATAGMTAKTNYFPMRRSTAVEVHSGVNYKQSIFLIFSDQVDRPNESD